MAATSSRFEALQHELSIKDAAWRRRVRRLERRLQGGPRFHVDVLAIMAKVLMAVALGVAAALVTYGAIVWYSGAAASTWHSAGQLSSLGR
jgi:hypothetical protein